MKINLISQAGNRLKEEVDLPEEIFGAELNKDLVAQYVRVYLANQRTGTSKIKTRGEVRGGGRKPWPQKGTGRARHGSIRSPIWVGGGTVHGPEEPQDWSLKMPRKMRRAALFSALSDKLENNALGVVKELKFGAPKTKDMAEFLHKAGLSGKILLVLEEANKNAHENIMLSSRNIPALNPVQARQINAYNVLNSDYVLFTKGALEVLKKLFGEE